MHICLPLIGFVAVVLNVAASHADCNPALVRAFFDVYHEKVGDRITSRTQAHSCQSARTNLGIGYTAVVDGVPLTDSLKGRHASQACSSNDRNFFQDYSRDLLVEQASADTKADLIRNCFSGMEMEIRENSGGIFVTAYAHPPMNEAVVITTSAITPQNGVTTTETSFKAKDEIPQLGRVGNYTRRTNEDITFSVNTHDMSATGVAPGVEVFGVSWAHVSIEPGNYNDFWCKGTMQYGKQPLVIKRRIDAKTFGVNGRANGPLQDSICSMMFGPIVRIYPGTGEAIHTPDKWLVTPTNANDPSAEWTCMRNGVRMDTPLTCPDSAKDKWCGTPTGRKAYCIELDQDQGRTAFENRMDLNHLPETPNEPELNAMAAPPQ